MQRHSSSSGFRVEQRPSASWPVRATHSPRRCSGNVGGRRHGSSLRSSLTPKPGLKPEPSTRARLHVFVSPSPSTARAGAFRPTPALHALLYEHLSPFLSRQRTMPLCISDLAHICTMYSNRFKKYTRVRVNTRKGSCRAIAE